MKGATPKQQEILNFIQNYIKQYSYSPSYREIMAHFSLSSPGSVYKYVQTLKRKGLIAAENHCSRSIIPTQAMHLPTSNAEIQLPLIGNICVGQPIEMFIQSRPLGVPSFLAPYPEKTYLLRAQGNGLRDECISEGDLLLVEARSEAQMGEMIIGRINKYETIIKRYYPEGQYIRLEGGVQDPLILKSEQLLIQGILVGVIRAY